jgi:hypothetical protein
LLAAPCLASLATPGRFTGDHPVDHAQLARLAPERGLFATILGLIYLASLASGALGARGKDKAVYIP